MELRHLRYYTAVVRAGSISAAAEVLHIAQPALSRQIRELEQELGVRLLVRRARGITTTDAGAAFFDDAEALLASAQQAKRRCLDVARGTAGRLRLGFVGTAAHLHFVSEGIRDFRAKYPGIALELHRLRSEANLEALRAGEIDVAVCYHRNPQDSELEGQLLREEPYLLALLPDHPLAGRGSATLAEIAQDRLLWYRRSLGEITYAQIERAFAARKLDLQLVQEGESEETLLELVAVGMGCTLVAASAATRRDLRHLRLLPIRDLDVMLRLELVWRRASGPAVSAFLDLLRPLIAAEQRPASGPCDPIRSALD